MIITANIGGFDEERPCETSTPFKIYTEENLPFPLPNLNNRLRGKYIKIQTHRFLEFDRMIWTDGSVQVVSKRFAPFIYGLLREQNADVALPFHPDRSNVYDELNYILDGIKAGKDYVKDRYENEPLSEELAFYTSRGLPHDFPLYACRLFARVNTAKVNEAFNDWWMGCLEYSNFDQSYFSYIAWRHRLKIVTFDYSWIIDKYIKVHRHKNDNRPPL